MLRTVKLTFGDSVSAPMQLTAEQIETIAKVIDDNTIEEKLLSGYITSPNGIAASLALQLSQNGVEYVGKLNSDKFTISASSSSIGEGGSVTINVSGVSASMLNFEVDSVAVTDGGVSPDYVKALCSFDGNVLHVAKGSNVNGWRANVTIVATPKFTSPDTATARIEVKGRIIPTGISVNGPSEILVENGEGHADYTIEYTPSTFDGDASVNVTVGGEYAQFVTPSNISRNGFRLSTTASKFTADITVEVIVEGVKVAKTFSVEFQKVVAPAPFIIHNPTSSTIQFSITTSRNVWFDVDTAHVTDYQLGMAEDGAYDFDSVEWNHVERTNDSNVYFDISAGCSLFIKSNTMPTWGANGYYTNFIIRTTGLVFDGDIMALLKDRKMTQPYAFYGLFSASSGITKAPKLPAKELTEKCYALMFYQCTSLIEAPELPALEMKDQCYSSMFSGCTALKKTMDSLPATRLDSACYYRMFYGCSALEEAMNILPSLTSVTNCYNSMFRDCVSLHSAPTIMSSNSFVTNALSYMFSGCRSLNYIKYMGSIFSSSNATNWVNEVAREGTFVMNAAATWNPESYRGPSGIPEGWTVLTATN